MISNIFISKSRESTARASGQELDAGRNTVSLNVAGAGWRARRHMHDGEEWYEGHAGSYVAANIAFTKEYVGAAASGRVHG